MLRCSLRRHSRHSRPKKARYQCKAFRLIRLSVFPCYFGTYVSCGYVSLELRILCMVVLSFMLVNSIWFDWVWALGGY